MDSLLRRADQAIRESEAIRDQVRASLLLARISSARVRAATQCARDEIAKSRQLRTEMADKGRAPTFALDSAMAAPPVSRKNP